MAAGGATTNRKGCTACIAKPATPAPIKGVLSNWTFPNGSLWNAHFRPDKSRGVTGKSLIVLNPWLSLN
jgi:hypothetical protein